MIRMQAVRKSWGNIHAVSGVDFDLAEGEIHALLGENGAGKSTLMKMLAGAVIPDAGTMLLDGKPLRFADPADAMAAGIAMVYQENSLVPSMTVAQNMFLGEEKAFNRLRPLYIAAQQFLQSLNFNVDPWAQVATLGVAQRQMVEIARAVRRNARVSPQRRSRPKKSAIFLNCCAVCGKTACPSCSSATRWKKPWTFPTALPCCATALWSMRA